MDRFGKGELCCKFRPALLEKGLYGARNFRIWLIRRKRSYKEYKDLLPLSKQADAYRQENEQLKAQLAAKGQSNGGGAAASDVAYWRDKYDELLTSLD